MLFLRWVCSLQPGCKKNVVTLHANSKLQHFFCMKKQFLLTGLLMASVAGAAQNDTIYKEHELHEVHVVSKSNSRRLAGAVNGMRIGQGELVRAACCNLGESFTTNPAVDVSYTDAATGAKQIKLLGLAGTYVQMMVEGMPAFRGAASPYSLGYVPGTWMKGINVSKGLASVKHGYESITGQIDIDYLKPEDEPVVNVNLYGDIQSRFEANFDTNMSLGKGWSANILGHYENRWGEHDKNSDGFQDMPKIQQYNLTNRWHYATHDYIFHGGWQVLAEDRNSGQTAHSSQHDNGHFQIGIETERYEAFMKHAFILDHEHNANIALVANASLHKQNAVFGNAGYKKYDVDEKNLNAQLIYEMTFGHHHSLSAGASMIHDYFKECSLAPEGYLLSTPEKGGAAETTTGGYAQYTLDLDHELTFMAGVRYDYSSIHGGFITPRAHIKYQPWDVFSLRLSAGKGYRTVHALAENSNLLASGRIMQIGNLKQEEAWNYGASMAFNIPIAEKTLKLNAEYYYTDFVNQAVIDFDSDPGKIIIDNLNGESYSHVVQVDATYPFFKGLTLTAAYRKNIIKCTYGGILRDKPLTSGYKSLVTASYKTPLEKWQFDVTFQMNGGGRMPAAGETKLWEESYKALGQLSAQVTRRFKKFEVYLGGENLTDYSQKNAIISANNPWSASFDPTMVYGPIDGAMAYLGVRISL